jgi:hypothetical protein
MTPEEFIESLHAQGGGSDYAIATPAPALISGAVSRYETAHAAGGRIRVDEVSAVLAPYVGRLGCLRAQRGEVVDSLTLDANYVRRTDAELHWKAPKES